ncbi:MAG: serine/threonine protein kinase [Planctomycetes bacterium]|nr:serine/threonine protein kinase [Planctomycetota bacterium]
MTAPPLSSEASDPAVRRAEEVAGSMAAAWRDGVCDGADAWLARHPELGAAPAAALRLVWEEICLRDDFGLPVVFDDFAARFPDRRAGLRTVFDCRQLFDAGPGEPDFPAVGDVCCDFLLTAEIGRGARGRVFRARELSLGSRPVVLKFTPRDGGEHLSLARLQHTHVVPLYSAHDLPEQGLRVLCMPDLGGSVLDRDAGPTVPLADGRPDHRAVARVGACLAEALADAHARGLVHLDVKPSNVLVTADGVPMLLDFHLARGPIPVGADAGTVVGGTRAFMSPEQRAAWEAVCAGRPVPAPVDGRSDLYSLALTLRAALGVPPGPGWEGGGHVPWGLRAVLDRCAAPDPADRYPTAGELAADLRRHAADLPLRGVRNPSWSERWAKWRRRRPQSLAVLAARVAVLAVVTGVGLLGLHRARETVRRAETALDEARELRRAGDAQGANRVLSRALADVRRVPLTGELRGRLGAELRRARALESARCVHDLAERLRRRYAAAYRSPTAAAEEDGLRRVWDSKAELLAELGATADAVALRADLLDLAVLWADRRVQASRSGADATALREALGLLGEAEQLFGASQPLCLERQLAAEALGDLDLAKFEAARAATLPAVSAWDHVARGRWLLRRNDPAGAATAFARATDLRPGEFWPWFWTGLCAHDRGAFAEAATAFTVCIALAPDRAECYFNRAAARAAAGEHRAAREDLARAVALEPSLAEAARGLPVPRDGAGTLTPPKGATP